MSPDQLDRLLEYAADPARGIVAIYLFGSHAEGRTHHDSDLDLGILLDRTIYRGTEDLREARVRLTSDLISVLAENRVDLVVLNDLTPELGRRIVTEGRLLYMADPEAEHAFRRDIQLRAADLDPFLARARRIKLKRLRG